MTAATRTGHRAATVDRTAGDDDSTGRTAGRATTLRIALFTEVFPPKIDGITNTLSRVLAHLEAEGIAALVVAPKAPGLPARFAGAPVLAVPSAPFPLYPELRLAAPWRRLDAALDAFGPTVVHLAGPVAAGLIGLSYARRRSLPLVTTYHTDIPGFAARWGHRWLVPALWAMVRRVHGRADLNLAPSAATAAQLRSRGVPNVAVWSRGVDAALFHPDRRRDAVRHELSGGWPEAPLLAYVGRLSAEKRIDWIAAALDAHPGARLAVIGDGPARPALERAFAGRPVVFTGFRTGTALAEAYAAADVFVFPGANETLGNVVLEAMASGLPVVVPAAGGVLEHVTDGVTGRTFHPEDRTDLARVVRDLLATPAERARLGAAARAHAAGRTWGAECGRLVGWWEGVVAVRRPRGA